MTPRVRCWQDENLLGFTSGDEPLSMADLLGLPPIARRGGVEVGLGFSIRSLTSGAYPHYVRRSDGFTWQDYKLQTILAGYALLGCLDLGGVGA